MSLDSRESLQSVEGIKAEAIKLEADGQFNVHETKLFRSVKCSTKTYKLKPSKKMSGIKQIEVSIADDEEDDDDMGFVELDNGLVIYKKLVERLYPHQINGVKWLYNLFKNRKKGGILADDMGLGKTIQMIAFISAMFRMQRIKNVLLVIPLSVIPNWVAEFKNWAPEIWVECFHGAASKRNAILHQCMMKRSVCITTYRLIVTQWQALSETIDGREFVWDYIALDEGHWIRNPSKTTKRLHSIPSRNRIILTGTPLQNKLCDLWALMDWVTQGSLLGTKKTFRSDYELPIERARQRDSSASEIQLGNSMAASLKELTDPYILRRTKASLSKEEKENASSGDASKVADGNQDLSTLCNQPTFPKLSTKNDFVVWVYLSDVQQEIYKNFIELDDVKALLTSHRSPVVYLTILKKICDHPRLLSTKACLELGLQSNDDSISEDMNCSAVEECAANRIHNIPDETLIKESGKLQFLIDLLLRLRDEGHRTLIFSMSRKMLNIIQRILTNHKFKIMRLDGRVTKLSERVERVRKFQEDPSYDVFLLTTQVGGVGLTLTAADRVVIYDPSWNPATDDQAIDRLYRIGQKKSVAVYRLITCGSVEEKIYRRQIFKNSVIQQAVQGNKDPYRYFTRQELFELFSLDDVTKSDTQLQLEQLHGHQRNLDEYMQTHIKFIHELYMFGVSDHDLMFSRKADDFDEDEAQAESFNNAVEEARNRLKLESDQYTGHSETESRWGMFNEYRRDALVPVKDLEPIYPIEGISDKLVTMSLPSKDEPSSSNWTRRETPQIKDIFDIFGEQVSSDDDPVEGDEEWKAVFARADEANEQERSRKSPHTNVHCTTTDSPLVAATTRKRPFIGSDSENSSSSIDDELPSLASNLSQSLNQSAADISEKKIKQISDDDVTRPSAGYVSDSDEEEADDVVRDFSYDDLDCQKDAIASVNDVINDATKVLDLSDEIGSDYNDSDVANNKDDVMEEVFDDDGSDGSSFYGRADDNVPCATTDSPLVATTTGKQTFIGSDSENSSNNSAIYPIEGISDKLGTMSLPSKDETDVKFEANFDDLPDIKKKVVNTDEVKTNLSFSPQTDSTPKIRFEGTPAKNVPCTTTDLPVVATTTRKQRFIGSDNENSSNSSAIYPIEGISDKLVTMSLPCKDETDVKFEANFDDLPDIKKKVVNTDEVKTNLSFSPQSDSTPKIRFEGTPAKNVPCTTIDLPLVATTTRKRPFIGSDSENSSNSSAIYPLEGVNDKLVTMSLPSKIETDFKFEANFDDLPDIKKEVVNTDEVKTNLSFSPQSDSTPKIRFEGTPAKNVPCTTTDLPLVATTTRKQPFIGSDSENSSNSSAIYPLEGVNDKLVTMSLPSKIETDFKFEANFDDLPDIKKEVVNTDEVKTNLSFSPQTDSTPKIRFEETPAKNVPCTTTDLPLVATTTRKRPFIASDSENSSNSSAIYPLEGVNDKLVTMSLPPSKRSRRFSFNPRTDSTPEMKFKGATAKNVPFTTIDSPVVERTTKKRLFVDSDSKNSSNSSAIYPIEGISDKFVTPSMPSKKAEFMARFHFRQSVRRFSFKPKAFSFPKITFEGTPAKNVPCATTDSPVVATTTRKRPFIAFVGKNSFNSSDDELPSLASSLSQSLNQSAADLSEKKIKQTADDDVTRPSVGYVSDLDDKEAVDVIHKLNDDDFSCQKDMTASADDVINDDSDGTEILDFSNGSGSGFSDSDVGNHKHDMEQLTDDDGSDASSRNERAKDVEEARNRLKLESDQFTGHSETESKWGMFNEDRRVALVPVKDLEPIYPIESISDKLVTMSLPSKDEPSSSNWTRRETPQSVHSTPAISPLVATTTRKRPFIGSDSENSSNSNDDELPSLAFLMSQSLNESEADSYEKKMKQTADDDVIRILSDDDLGLEKDAIASGDDVIVINDNSDATEILDFSNGSGSGFSDSDVGNHKHDMEQLPDDDGSDASSLNERAKDIKMNLS